MKTKSISLLFCLFLSLAFTAETEAQTKKNEFPFYAVLTCGMNQRHISTYNCFLDDVKTELELRNGSDYGLYTILELTNKGIPNGRETRDGFVIQLRKTFAITAQNANSSLILGVRIYKTETNELLFQKQVSRFNTISVKN